MSTGTLSITANTSRKSALTTPLATYEKRGVVITPESTATLPAGSYAMEVVIDGLVVARNGLTLTNNTLTGTVDLNTDEMADCANFNWDTKRITGILSVWDATNETLWAQGWIDIIKTAYNTSSTTTPVPNISAKGSETIDSGTDTVTIDISSYGLSDTPSQVFVSVETPTGGTQLLQAFCTAKSATELTFTLTSETPDTGYTLHWMVIA